RRVEARQRRGVARFGELSRVAVEARAGTRSDPVADERTGYHGVRVLNVQLCAFPGRATSRWELLSRWTDRDIPRANFVSGWRSSDTVRGRLCRSDLAHPQEDQREKF